MTRTVTKNYCKLIAPPFSYLALFKWREWLRKILQANSSFIRWKLLDKLVKFQSCANFCFNDWSFHWKSSDSHLILQDFYKKMIILRNCAKNHHSISCVESPIFEESDQLCLYKNLANQAFSFISSKVVYFKKHLAINYRIPKKHSFYCH